MERNIYKHLIKWMLSSNRKPLVLYGARQVGKTYILKEFGRNEYGEPVQTTLRLPYNGWSMQDWYIVSVSRWRDTRIRNGWRMCRFMQLKNLLFRN